MSKSADWLLGEFASMRRAVRDSRVPVVVLTAKPAREWFGTCVQDGDTAITVRVDYGEGDRALDGPAVSVEAARWSGINARPPTLRPALEAHLRSQGEWLAAVTWTEGSVTLLVDGEPVTGEITRAGTRWWSARCERDGVDITVIARDWHPAEIAVTTDGDLDALILRGRPPRPAPPDPAAPVDPVTAEELPEGLSHEPHRALVDVVLRSGREQQRWRRDGGPEPELPRYWGTLWRAAVHRHVALTDRPEHDAEREVQDILNQLGELDREASWFRDEGPLRERAIAETLLLGTGLTGTVSSSAAQAAWRHGRGLDAWAAWAAALPR